jgi:hypothetical protein
MIGLLKDKTLRLAALILLVAVPLAFLLFRVFGGFVRDVITVPFLYIIWFARLYVRAVPQTLFWGALLLFGLGLALTSLLVGSGGAGRRIEESEGSESSDPIYPGRVKQLASQIHFAGRSSYFRSRLTQRLRVLMLQSLDRRAGYAPVEMERALDELDAPPHMRAFFREERGLTPPSRPMGLLARLKVRLRGDEAGAMGVARTELEHIVQFLEGRLEGL